MDLEILMSAMEIRNINQLELKNRNINSNILVINQNNNNFSYETDHIRIITFNEIGLSKSRNRAIENSKGDICLITDNDTVFKNNYKKIILQAFEDNPEADIITFQIETTEGKPYKKYRKDSFYHDKKSILRVNSIEIAFKREVIINSEIKFDEKFGLGSKYGLGEENIFLIDCFKKGLKIMYTPIPIVIHPLESTGTIFNVSNTYSKGAVFFRLFGYKSILINIIFAIKKYKEYKNKFSFFYYTQLLNEGAIDYLKERKRL